MSVMATSQVFATQTMTTRGGVNVRSGPSIDDSKVGYYPAGTTLSTSSTRVGDWFNTDDGWVYGRLLNEYTDDNYGEVLGSYTTWFGSSASGRKHNVEYSANEIDGTVIPPGGYFSFNEVANSWADKKNFRAAKVISNKKLVDGFGGGLCQTSSTLYNAMKNVEGLTITERHNHSLSVGYVPAGEDATVASSSGKDFVFKNTNDFSVVIDADCNLLNGSLEVKIAKQ